MFGRRGLSACHLVRIRVFLDIRGSGSRFVGRSWQHCGWRDIRFNKKDVPPVVVLVVVVGVVVGVVEFVVVVVVSCSVVVVVVVVG